MADISWITERLCIGGAVESLFDAREIAAEGVTHVLSLRMGDKNPSHVEDEEKWWKQIGGVKFLNDPAHDDGRAKSTKWFKMAIDFAFEALLSKPTNKVLIHCKQGEHRSPAVAYAILRAWGTNAEDAQGHVEEARDEADVEEYQADAEKALKVLGYT